MANYKISVIVAIYKVDKYLEECLESIVRQTYTNLEIILIDDGSPDDCPLICEKYARSDRRIKVIHKTNGGLSDAKNTGLNASSGDFIIFIDGDDFISLDMLEKMAIEIERSGSDIVLCDYFKVIAEKKIPIFHEFEPGILVRDEALSLVFSEKISSHSWNKLCKASLYEKVNFPFGQTYEDLHETYKVFVSCECVSYIKQCLYYYRINPQGICLGYNPRKILDLFLAFKERLEFAKEYFSDSTDICSKHLFEHGITVYNKLLINGTELVIKETELAKVFDYLSLNRKLAYQSHHLALKKKVQVWLICHLRNFYNCSYKALGTMISLARKIRKHYSVPI